MKTLLKNKNHYYLGIKNDRSASNSLINYSILIFGLTTISIYSLINFYGVVPYISKFVLNILL